MRYNHSLEEAAEYLRMTLKFVGRFDLRANPVNYTVWYEYASKLNPQLLAAIEDRLVEKRPVTDEETDAWFQEYIVFRGQDLVLSVKSEFIKILQEVFGELSTAGEDVSHFGKTLARFSEDIKAVDDPETLEDTLKGLLLEVKKVEQSSSALERRLKQADEQVKELQSKLKEVEQHATVDPLTNLYNRRAFEEKLPQHMAQTSKTGTDLALLIIDIDHFKRVNDTYGHLTGDDLLRIIAKTLKDFVKGKDIVCRYGGEEFVVLLPDTPLEGAVTVAENIRKHFAQMSWKQKSTGVSMGKVTLSAGVSLYRPGETMEAFVQRGDVALYRSKKSGRNRVTVEKR
jgi:diguanylate cyclase